MGRSSHAHECRRCTPSSRAGSVVYDLDDAGRMSAASSPDLVAMPFRRPEAAELPDTKVRLEVTRRPVTCDVVRVLIVEDERKLAQVLSLGERRFYIVATARARQLASSAAQLIRQQPVCGLQDASRIGDRASVDTAARSSGAGSNHDGQRLGR